jgi:hypothetical protein
MSPPLSNRFTGQLGNLGGGHQRRIVELLRQGSKTVRFGKGLEIGQNVEDPIILHFSARVKGFTVLEYNHRG